MDKIKQIEIFLKKLKKTNVFLSPKEKVFLKDLFSKGFSIEEIQKKIKQELKKYPPNKRKRISLNILLLNIEKNKDSKAKIFKQRKNISKLEKKEKWISFLNQNNIPINLLDEVDFSDKLSDLEIKAKVINYIWKNLSQEEKEKIKGKAVLQIKKNHLISNIDKETLKSFITKIIEEKYKIPD